MYDRTRQHESTTTDHRRDRSRTLTARGLVATALLAAVVPAVAWALAHPLAATALALAAAVGYVTGRFARVRATGRARPLRAVVHAALGAVVDRGGG